MIRTFLKHYLLTLLPFVVLDALWLGTVAPKFYQAQIGHLMTPTPNWLAAILFYLLFIVGVVVFVSGPGIQSGDWKGAALRGALFGLVSYATYDLTNLATLTGWPVQCSTPSFHDQVSSALFTFVKSAAVSERQPGASSSMKARTGAAVLLVFVGPQDVRQEVCLGIDQDLQQPTNILLLRQENNPSFPRFLNVLVDFETFPRSFHAS